MRRDLLPIAVLAALLCGLALAAAWALLAAPPVPARLLPADAVIAHTQPLAGGRRLVVARLAPRQGLHHLYRHFTEQGWRLGRANLLPEDDQQVYLRRSLGGYVLEVAVVAPASGRDGVAVTYLRCLRHVTCGRR
jgi:hypothetical protein